MKVTAIVILAALLIGAAIFLLPPLLGARLSSPDKDAGPTPAPTPAEADIPAIETATTLPEAVAGLTLVPTRRAGAERLTAQPAPATTPAAPDASLRSLSTLVVPATAARLPSVAAAPSVTAPHATPTARNLAATGARGGRGIYTGVSIGGVPWNMSALDNWEKNVAGKGASIVHFWVFWRHEGAYQSFERELLDGIRTRGSIPMITWAPEEPGLGSNQPDFQLRDIIDGKYDAYIRQWALDAKAWGKPFFLRWAHEPDGDWFPWGEDANGNQRGEYAVAWRHVHDIFTQARVTNVTWVWCPNVEWPDSPRSSYASLYPGDSYVDWLCVDGYNWGDDFPQNGGWSSFNQIFRYAYDAMTAVAPSKPMMLGEWASSEKGGSKADWIRDAFGSQIPLRFRKIAAVVWYNQRAGPVDWRIESSVRSAAAYRAVMASPAYRGAEYGGLTASPIPPP